VLMICYISTNFNEKRAFSTNLFKWISCLFTLVVIAFYQPITAQSYSKVNQFRPETYQAGNQNWDISIDQEGMVYLANNAGLLVQDGIKSRLYKLPSETIIRSVQAVGDRIYTGSFEEFGYWKKNDSGDLAYHSLCGIAPEISIENQEFWKIVPHNGKIYFQSFGMLLVYDGQTLQSIKLPGSILFLLTTGDRLFVQQIEGGIFEIINDDFHALAGSDIFNDTEIKAVISLNDNKLLFGTSSKGLFEYDGENFAVFRNEINDLLKNSTLNNGIRLGNKLIFGTILQGVFILHPDGRLENHLNSRNALQNNTILALQGDRDENLWVGMDKGFDFIWFKSPFENYHEPDVDIGAVYTAALYRDTLYIGTNQGIYYFEMTDNGRFANKNFIENTQGQSWFIKEIDGKLYAGLNEGTYVIENKELIEVNDINGGYNLLPFNANDINYLIQSTYNNIVVFQKQQAYWKKSKQITGFTAPARFLETDHLGRLLLGHTIKGIYLIKPSLDLDTVVEVNRLGEKYGLNFIANRFYNVDNRILIPSGDSIFQWDAMNEQVVPYPELNENLKSFTSAVTIIASSSQQYWFIKSSEIGLFEVRFGNAKILYRIIPDLYNLNLIEGYENIVALNDSLHLFCLENGFSILNINRLNRLEEKHVPPIIKKATFKNINDKAFTYNSNNKKPLKINNTFNSLDISFTNTEAVGRKKYFQYRLTGLDNKWSNWVNQSTVSYSRLPAGSYSFEVRSLSVKGIITPQAVLNFQIKQPWFLSGIALLADGVLLIALVLLIRLNYNRRRWNQQEKLLKEEREKLILEKNKAEADMITLSNEKLQSEISHKNMQLAKNTMSMIQKNELLISIKHEIDQLKKELGYRLPNKHYDSLIKLIDRGINSENDWEMFEHLFDQAHENFFKRLKTSYPDLTASDLRLCAYLRLNLSSKEIAPLLNISVRGVEEKRYRIRKRMGLTSDQGLSEFIVSF
jgi:DNA-binding CsgD family transcriptional regulator